uniref:GP-PDE domain-containing protein n=1 Tax=Chromera velia CCMP2878 TaxID=1169474 RepID=A0A0G4GL22_9ALVE|eukprot:Cvel_22387.t1-p1 / transcript=Cvel_22387.t1 / gene=Cvel_22387 / organism=Chromera_velia_CCMP2878 / gene_product=hypothetical protein / transcript_product=hypothetical protein / location=Cvel_scaffold2195:4409-7871(-) / protein_length=472 / sequence_SO=supercontig / SO=protein_coding / is_pseudo=false
MRFVLSVLFAVVHLGPVGGSVRVEESVAAAAASAAHARNEVGVFVHRGSGVSMPGSPSRIPENSLWSFRSAVSLGAKGVELDVWLTADDEVLITHASGGESEGFLHEVSAFGWKDEKETEPIQIEHFRYSEVKTADALKLRESWGTAASDLSGKTPVEVSERFQRMDKKGQKMQREWYSHLKKPIETFPDVFLEIPKLEHVLEEFSAQIEFNVELKGTKPRLSAKVAEIVKRYPEAKVVISSFQWIPPEEDAATTCTDPVKADKASPEKCPNGRVFNDLLFPISEINKRLPEAERIPIALLVEDRGEGRPSPSTSRLAECAQRYLGAFQINIPVTMFLPEDFADLEPPPAPMDLQNFVRSMWETYSLAVATWWYGGVDREVHLWASLWSGVSAVIPNNGERAMTVTRVWADPRQDLPREVKKWGDVYTPTHLSPDADPQLDDNPSLGAAESRVALRGALPLHQDQRLEALFA